MVTWSSFTDRWYISRDSLRFFDKALLIGRMFANNGRKMPRTTPSMIAPVEIL